MAKHVYYSPFALVSARKYVIRAWKRDTRAFAQIGSFHYGIALIARVTFIKRTGSFLPGLAARIGPKEGRSDHSYFGINNA